MTHQSTSIYIYIYTPALRKPTLAQLEYLTHFEITCRLKLLLVATYLYAEENFHTVHTVLNQCKAETEMLLDSSYLPIIQGELC